MRTRIVASLTAFLLASGALLALGAATAEGYRPAGTRAMPPLDSTPANPGPGREARPTAEPAYDTLTIGLPTGSRTARLAQPSQPGPHPALVLVHGGGPGFHWMYGELVRALAARGVAVLVADKDLTGYGPVTRDFQRLADDAVAQVEWLRGQPGIDPGRVGVLGFSEGGWVGVRAALAERGPDRIVLVSAPVVSPLEETTLMAARRLSWAPDPVLRAAVAGLAGGRTFINYLDEDSRKFLPAVRQPLLAVWGINDDMIPIPEAAHRLESGLPQRPAVHVVDGMGHLPGGDDVDEVAGVVAGWILDPQATAFTTGATPTDLTTPPVAPRAGLLQAPALHLGVSLAFAVAAWVVAGRRAQGRRTAQRIESKMPVG